MISIINKVLLIEDEPDVRGLMVRILNHYGITVIEATTGEEALLKLEEGLPPTVIIVDLALPGMDGWSVLSHLKNNPKLSNTSCIAITAYHTAELAQQAIQAGFNAYFTKPFNVTTLVHDLEDVVRV